MKSFRIGEFTIFPGTNEIAAGGRRKSLEKRAMDVLVYLYERRGQTVSREELLENIWGRTAISDHSVAVVISDIRKALGDPSRNSRYIRTITKKGYMLVADAPADSEQETSASSIVHNSAENDPATPASKPRTSVFWRWRPVWLLYLIMISVIVTFYFKRDDEALGGHLNIIGIHDITVSADTAIVSGDADGAVEMAAVLTDILASELGNNSPARIVRLGRGGADRLNPMEGQKARLSGRLVVRADDYFLSLTLETLKTGEILWGGTRSMQDSDFIAIGLETVRDIQSRTGLSVEDRQDHVAVSEKAYGLYWRARFLWSQRQRIDTIQAHRNVQEALRIAPDFAEAHAFMSVLYAHKTAPYLALPSADTNGLSLFHADRALALSPHLADAYAAKALVAFYGERDREKALAILEGASDSARKWPLLLQTRGMVLSAMGRAGESLEMIDTALSLDPFAHDVNWDRVWFTYLAGDIEKTQAAYDLAVERTGHEHWHYKALIAMGRGEHRAAIDSWIRYADILDLTLVHDPDTSVEETYDAFAQQAIANRRDNVTNEIIALWQLYAGDIAAMQQTLLSIPRDKEHWMHMWINLIPAFAHAPHPIETQLLPLDL